MPITPETAAAAREARRHLAAAKADIARAESIIEASDTGRWPDAAKLAVQAWREVSAAASEINAAVEMSGAGADSAGDNDTATDKPPPRENDTGP